MATVTDTAFQLPFSFVSERLRLFHKARTKTTMNEIIFFAKSLAFLHRSNQLQYRHENIDAKGIN